MPSPNKSFIQCWVAAGKHLNAQVNGGIKRWFRAHTNPPFLEHLSFGIGNQLFFIRIEAPYDQLDIPGNVQGLHRIAAFCRGHACLMPMRKTKSEEWEPVFPDWGLLDARTGILINPSSFENVKDIEMTAWELHDFAVQIVRDQLEKDGYRIMSWSGDPEIDPSIWFIGSSGPEWVVVRSVKYPVKKAEKPINLQIILKKLSPHSINGNFASVAFCSSDQSTKNEDEPVLPLWRDHGLYVSYTGLEKLLKKSI